MIRTTNHTLFKFTNTGKINKLSKFIDECNSTAQQYLNYLFSNKINFTINEEDKYFDIKNDYLEIPPMLSNVDLESKVENFRSGLSARVKKCILTQVLGILKASTEQRKKRIYVFNKLCEEGKYNEKLQQNLEKFKVIKPNLKNINFEFNSICCDWEESKNTKVFNGYVRLSSLGTSFGKIKLPIKFHRNNKKYKDWKMLSSFLIGKDFINIRWEKEIELKKEGREVGGDQGKLTILTLSDRQTTPKLNSDNYSLDKIIDKLSRKKKGSIRFLRTQSHRKNFINWSINQLNLKGIKTIKLEEIVNINFGTRTSRKMSHWTNTAIRDKIRSHCELNGVHFTLQSCTYKSQRCSECGMVRKSNRKGKVYLCSNCDYSDDADFNASRNHEQNLPDIPTKLRKLNLNRKGFFWKEAGFYDLNGAALTVPHAPEINVLTRKDNFLCKT
jgi:transposase